eukprot:gnl/Spiro4/6685_TR3446_c0_g2_i2.p1 gnl/Spiro4/6685_TR3446_c0_g2~~gnl/Spiro4/6685_TR3446_c0_g2_i2.p1  ORF type:complete len:1221 (-),score=379.91 gnl/Spiro4/6685_TR3446_c0_g2_i2:16-3678(-)
MQTLAKLSFHQRAVTSLTFSSDGTKLVSAGMDADHTICVWDWKSGRLITSSPASKQKILMLVVNEYLNDTLQFVCCGVGHISFWDLNGENLTGFPGRVGEKGSVMQTNTCCRWTSKTRVVSGTVSGELYQWDRVASEAGFIFQVTKTLKCNQGPILCMGKRSRGIMVGGNDGTIKLWQRTLAGPVEDFTVLSVCSSGVQSLHWHSAKSVLVGTRRGEILLKETNGSSTKKLVQATNCSMNVADGGVATHPLMPRFAVCHGRLLRIYDPLTATQVAFAELADTPTCCAYSPDGNLLAVGFATQGFAVYDNAVCNVETKSRSGRVNVVQFSPDGTCLAIGGAGQNIDIYDCQTWEIAHQIHVEGSGNVTHFDFSRGDWRMQVCTDADELSFYRVKQTAKLPPSKVKDVVMVSQTSIFGWNVQGIWPELPCPLDRVLCVDRSPCGALIASGNSVGVVQLWNFPCPPGQQHRSYLAHGGPVRSARFLFDDSRLITQGPYGVCQWKHISRVDDDYEDPETFDEIDPLITSLAQAATSHLFAPYTARLPHSDYDRMAEKWHDPGFLGPTQPPKPSTNPHLLRLAHLSGYRPCRHNGVIAANGSFVYHVGCVAVVQSQQGSQHYIHHTSDVRCMTLHPGGKIAATATCDSILIWDIVDQRVLCSLALLDWLILPSPRDSCLVPQCLSFSQDGNVVACVAYDGVAYHLGVFEWACRRLLATVHASNSQVYEVRFSPFDSSALTTVGENHVRFWTFNGSSLGGSKPQFGVAGKKQTNLCVDYDYHGQVLTGTMSGHIFLWRDRRLQRSQQAHEGPVICLHAMQDGRVVSGGKDFKVRVWTPDLTQLVSMFFNAPVINIFSEQDCNSILVGLKDGCLRLVRPVIADANQRSDIVIAQPIGECITAVAVCGSYPQVPSGTYAIATESKHIKVFNSNGVYLCFHDIRATVRSLAWAPNKPWLMAACDDGLHMCTLELRKLSPTAAEYVWNLAPVWREGSVKDITVMCFAPAVTPTFPSLLAMARSETRKVQVFLLKEDNAKMVHDFEVDRVAHMDWSADATWLRVDDASPLTNPDRLGSCHMSTVHYLNLSVDHDVGLTTENSRNVVWASDTCIIGFGVKGLPPTHTVASNNNPTSKVLAYQATIPPLLIDSTHRINYTTRAPLALEIWPARGQPVAGATWPRTHPTYLVHGGFIKNIVFTPLDDFLISSDGESVAVWRHITGKTEKIPQQH